MPKHIRCRVCAGEADDYPNGIRGSRATCDECTQLVPTPTLTAYQDPVPLNQPLGEVKHACRQCLVAVKVRVTNRRIALGLV